MTRSLSPLGAVLFDMDGLLVDSEPLWFEVERSVVTKLGGEWTTEDQQALMGGSMERSVAYILGRAAPPESGGQVPGVSGDQVARWLNDGMTALMRRRGVPLMPGAGELLAEVADAGLPYALVTASQRMIMETVLEVTGLSFPATVCREDVTHGKPAPDPYLLAAQLLGVEPAACVALEDSPNGTASAQAAGCAVIVAPSAPVPPSPGRVFVSSLAEVDLAMVRSVAATWTELPGFVSASE